MKKQSVVIASLWLAACGGGGGGGSTTTPLPVSLSPAKFTATYLQGTAGSANLTATPNITFNSKPYIYIIDSRGVLTSGSTDITANTGTNSYNVYLPFSPTLVPGHYAGSFTVDICYDSQCATQYPGSPFSYPYDLTIVAGNPSPLSPLAGAGDWGTFQGNAQHTGFVPVTLNAASFNARWGWNPYGVIGTNITSVAISNGLIYFGTGKGSLMALNENDASAAWSHPFSAGVNPPAVANGSVYVAVGAQGTSMFGLDATTGAQLFESAQLGSQWDYFLAPTVSGGQVYQDIGTYGGIGAFNASTGATTFFNGNIGQYTDWTPTLDANNANAYAYINNNLLVINPATGALSNIIPDNTGQQEAPFVETAPVIGAPGSVIVADVSGGGIGSLGGDLTDFNTTKGSVFWTIAGQYDGTPAYANGTIYANNAAGASRLEARAESNGNLLWSWTPPAGETVSGNVLVTNNIVFTCTGNATYAIDLSTHQTVWSYPWSGDLAISANGLLYIDSQITNNLIAINLQ